jgi:hypothetical protein
LPAGFAGVTLLVSSWAAKWPTTKKGPLLDPDTPVFVQPLQHWPATFCSSTRSTKRIRHLIALTVYKFVIELKRMGHQLFAVLILALCLVVSFTSAGEFYWL